VFSDVDAKRKVTHITVITKVKVKLALSLTKYRTMNTYPLLK